MQQGYGGVSEIQQFMVDNGGAAFTISGNVGPGLGGSLHHSDAQPHNSQSYKYHLHHHLHHHHQQPSIPPANFSPNFSPSIPFTHQLFQNPNHHHQQQLQIFHHYHHQQLGLADNDDSGAEASNSPKMIGGGANSFADAMSFKLAIDGRRLDTWQEEEEETAVKEPFWRPLDIDYININNSNNHKGNKEKRPLEFHESGKSSNKKGNEAREPPKLFCELEAIYKPAAGLCEPRDNQAAGSGSALSGDTAIACSAVPEELAAPDTSTGEEAAPPPPPVKKFRRSMKSCRRHQNQFDHLGTIAAFFERAVKQLIDHQEGLHRRFMEAMAKRDQERSSREESFRKAEAANAARAAAARAHECALAAARQAAIISFLEKLTGEKLQLHVKPNDVEHEEDESSEEKMRSTRRWPKAEVEALIKVRVGLERRFQEPGLTKGPLWEEVSSLMAAMGYNGRCAKRCKEKWENINKYFRKSKESGKKRPLHSKTCTYFHHLDMIYSSHATANYTLEGGECSSKDNSELLDAIVVPCNSSGGHENKNVEDDDDDDDEEEEEEEEEEGLQKKVSLHRIES